MIGQMLSLIAVKPVSFLLQQLNTYPNQLTSDQQFEIARQSVHRHAGTLLVPIALFAMIVIIVWLRVRRKQALYRTQADLRKQLLDKFGSAQELAAFMESEGGRQFLGGMQAPSMGRLRFLPGGIITTMLGLAFLGLTLAGRHFIVPAVILLAVGIGLLISAAIAHKLSSNKFDQTINPGRGMGQLPPV